MSDRKYKLYSDSTCDLSEDILKNMDVTLLELSFEVNGVVKSKNDMTLPEFYSQMRNGAVTKTSQIGISDYEQAFEKELAAGYDVLYLGFSSGLSGSFNTSCIARDSVMEKYPEGKIICIDSLCASTGEGLLLIKADEKKKQGLSIDELAQWITDNRLHLCHVFTVDDLKYLHRGGRVSKTLCLFQSYTIISKRDSVVKSNELASLLPKNFLDKIILFLVPCNKIVLYKSARVT